MKPLLYLSRKEHFNAAHRLWNEHWSEEQNLAEFGACSNAHFHGHNFELIITVKGIPSDDTGCIMNLKILKQLIHQEIIDELDHKNLNLDVQWLSGKIPSIETLAVAIWDRMEKVLPQGAAMHKVQLWETHNNFVEYLGEKVA